MSATQQPALTELKVGIFVVVACGVLAVAIFSIGSQVGLFEEQFWALTYLSNVSGLKPGDVVLLGGVEVGNVARVEISPPGDLPQTMRNTQILQTVADLLDQQETLEARVAAAEAELLQARGAYRQAVQSLGAASREAQSLERRIEDLERDLWDHQRGLNRLRDDVENERAGLQNIEVEMRINSDYRDWIRADSRISLGSVGLLGDKYIEISLGRTDLPARTIPWEVEGWFTTKTTDVVLITGMQQPTFVELITGANDILANFDILSTQFQDIMRSFEAGEGTIGRFITDPSFYNNLNATVENANLAMLRVNDLVAELSAGPGTLGRLVQDDALHNRLVAATGELDQLLKKIDEGEGTLGRLVNDPTLFEKSDELLANLSEITGRIERGEGTLGMLSADEEMYASLRESVDELAGILKDVEAGKGTLGRLAKDEALYQNLNEVSSELVKLIYDIRQDPRKFLTIRFQLF
jgi:phospholipid/cholesterol/gamma-HCH transport system substrate-binding protein